MKQTLYQKIYKMIPFCVAIPSYCRVSVLLKCTLPLCCTLWGIPEDAIYVFVVEEEECSYKHSVHSMFPGVHIVRGPLGLHHMRNFITQYFPEGAPVLHMDDDIQNLMLMHEDTSVENQKSCLRYPLVPIQDTYPDMCQWISSAFDHTKSVGASLFGIYPVKNGYFMKDLPVITYDLRFCVGAFWGAWNRHAIHIHIEEKEDFERTIQAYQNDGRIVRFNRICPVTTYYKTKGGMQSRNVNRIETNSKSCAFLVEQYPQYCKLYHGKKSRVEVRLRCSL